MPVLCNSWAVNEQEALMQLMPSTCNIIYFKWLFIFLNLISTYWKGCSHAISYMQHCTVLSCAILLVALVTKCLQWHFTYFCWYYAPSVTLLHIHYASCIVCLMSTVCTSQSLTLFLICTLWSQRDAVSSHYVLVHRCGWQLGELDLYLHYNKLK